MATRQQIKAFREEAYMVGDFLSAAICEVAMGRSASALEAVAQLNKSDRVEFALICGDEHGAAKAEVAVARWIADAAAQVASEAQGPDEQCPEHGCAAWRCDNARHGKVAS